MLADDTNEISSLIELQNINMKYENVDLKANFNPFHSEYW